MIEPWIIIIFVALLSMVICRLVKVVPSEYYFYLALGKENREVNTHCSYIPIFFSSPFFIHSFLFFFCESFIYFFLVCEMESGDMVLLLRFGPFIAPPESNIGCCISFQSCFGFSIPSFRALFLCWVWVGVCVCVCLQKCLED